MLNKNFLYSLPVVLTLSFAACGSSSQESATQEEQLLSSGYPVVVERGPVFDANVLIQTEALPFKLVILTILIYLKASLNIQFMQLADG